MGVTSSLYKKELYQLWKESSTEFFEDFLLTDPALNLMDEHSKPIYSLLWAANMKEMEEEYADVVFVKLKEAIKNAIQENIDDWNDNPIPFTYNKKD